MPFKLQVIGWRAYARALQWRHLYTDMSLFSDAIKKQLNSHNKWVDLGNEWQKSAMHQILKDLTM